MRNNEKENFTFYTSGDVKKNKWEEITVSLGIVDVVKYKCPYCGKLALHAYNFCPNCGKEIGQNE